MRKQRNVSQMKELNKTPGKKSIQMETSNLSALKFKTVVIRMLNELRGRIDQFSQNFNKNIENIKKWIQKTY